METTKVELLIKEINVNKPECAPDIWFFPQVCIIKTKTKGFWFWKKEIVKTEYKSFYNLKEGLIFADEKTAIKNFSKFENAVIGFRDFNIAKDWLDQYKLKIKTEAEAKNEKYWKFVAANTKRECKFHKFEN